MKRTRLKPMSAKRRKQNAERRAALHAIYGEHPRCALCGPLRSHGIVTGCNGWADDGDEVLRRSAGGSITDPENVRPVGRACHRWATEHPKQMREWGLERSRYEDGAA
jgi:hypothetical protein